MLNGAGLLSGGRFYKAGATDGEVSPEELEVLLAAVVWCLWAAVREPAGKE